MRSEKAGPSGTPSFGINAEKKELERELRAIRKTGGNLGTFFKEREVNSIRCRKDIKLHKDLAHGGSDDRMDILTKSEDSHLHSLHTYLSTDGTPGGVPLFSKTRLLPIPFATPEFCTFGDGKDLQATLVFFRPNTYNSFILLTSMVCLKILGLGAKQPGLIELTICYG